VELPHGLRQVGGPEVRPHAVGEDQLGVGALPEQEVREPFLAAGADQQVDVRHRAASFVRIGQQAREGLAGTAQEYGQKIADAATTAKDYVSDKISVAGDKFKDLQNVDYKQYAEEAKNYAREKPGQAILISAAAGFLIGLLLKSSNRR